MNTDVLAGLMAELPEGWWSPTPPSPTATGKTGP